MTDKSTKKMCSLKICIVKGVHFKLSLYGFLVIARHEAIQWVNQRVTDFGRSISGLFRRS